MSTQQIPSATQIAAARSVLWHQSTPVEPDNSAPGQDDAGSIDRPSASTPESREVSALAEQSTGASDSSSPEVETSSGAAPEIAEHLGIDVSDPDRPDTDIVPTAREAAPAVAILTQAAAREFLNRAGLLLFAAKPQFAGVPAPTFVEATLGAANANPSLTATETARTLLARLVADGSAVPLNLLGLPTTTAEAPDFVASAAAFPFIFTLRGDKAWKQPPSTSGPTKVSPLAANTYTLLIENGPKSAYSLTSDLGKEVTEAAVLRALSELWQQLRVLPVPQPGNKPTLWEPITTRFTKGIKTGANAGQPTALSTFVSLYLGQTILATEDEIETFLSPLAPRSRVRDVLHALSGARELETITVDGKHHLHIAGDLPLFASPRRREEDTLPVLSDDGSRIRKFVAKPRKLGTGSSDRPKPFRAPSNRDRSASSADRRPVSAASRPSFNKPWEEEKQDRANRAATSEDAATPEYQDVDLDAGTRAELPRRASVGRPGISGKASFGRKPGFAGKPGSDDRPRSGGDRPAFGRNTSSRGGDRPAFARNRNSSDSAGLPRDRADRPSRDGREGDRFQPRDSRRGFRPHPSAGNEGASPRRFGSEEGKSFSGGRPGFSRRPSEGERSAGERERRPFRRDEGSREEGRPPRREFSSGSRQSGPGSRPSFSGKPRFSRDRDKGETGGPPPFRKFDAPRTSRPPSQGDGSRPSRSSSEGGRPARRDSGQFTTRKPYGGGRTDRGEGSGLRREGFPSREGSTGSFNRREGAAPRRDTGFAPRRKEGFSGKREGDAPKKPFSSRSGPGAVKPFKKTFSRPAPDAPGASTFDKFKGNAKPWGNRPPARKFKPKEDEA